MATTTPARSEPGVAGSVNDDFPRARCRHDRFFQFQMLHARFPQNPFAHRLHVGSRLLVIDGRKFTVSLFAPVADNFR
jgi:hypothetical protein